VTSLAVRAAAATDIPRLAEIFRDASWSNVDDRPLFDEHPEFLDWSGEPAREGRTLLAEVDGVVAGFVSTVDGDRVVELEDLFVDPAFMRRGVATALVDAAAERARDAGAATLSVDANQHAVAFYKSAAFEIEGEIALDHGVAIRMTRPL
jgi:ribosomal protein S18 acetylase RimI-like enzyme